MKAPVRPRQEPTFEGDRQAARGLGEIARELNEQYPRPVSRSSDYAQPHVRNNVAKVEEDITDVETEISKLMAHDKPAASRAPEPPLDPRYGFVQVGASLAEKIVEAAQIQFNEAQANLEKAKLYADELKADVMVKDQWLASMEDRLKTFGSSMRKAHLEFHNPPSPKKSEEEMPNPPTDDTPKDAAPPR